MLREVGYKRRAVEGRRKALDEDKDEDEKRGKAIVGGTAGLLVLQPKGDP